MPRPISAGILLYRETPSGIEILLAHPGGPFFARKDDGWWMLPKGLVEPGEDLVDAALREFEEETGIRVAGPLVPLGETVGTSGKIVHIWACRWEEGDLPPIASNTFKLEWPPRSGELCEFPEVDRAFFFTEDEAREKANKTYLVFFDRLLEKLREMDQIA